LGHDYFGFIGRTANPPRAKYIIAIAGGTFATSRIMRPAAESWSTGSVPVTL
jgi:hypothetical protein